MARASVPGIPSGFRLALSALVGVVAMLGVPAAALADGSQVKLSLLAVDQPKAYFDLTMRPGETRSLVVEIANHGQSPIAARTYAADVYTIVNGGFGGRLHGEARTGTTLWVDYPTVVIQLPLDKVIRRAFTVAVPTDAGPGEYITSLVLENDQPILGAGTFALDQVVRQAIGVAVTVAGVRSPGLEIGSASHTVVTGRSVVAIAVQNIGNVRLKPIAEFTLLDDNGAQVSHATLPMDTFYAHTDTLVEIPLAALLLPGTYTVRLTLSDPAQATRADKSGIRLVVIAPAGAPIASGGVVPALTEVIQGTRDGQITLSVRELLVVLGLLLVATFAAAIVIRRRRHAPQVSAA